MTVTTTDCNEIYHLPAAQAKQWRHIVVLDHCKLPQCFTPMYVQYDVPSLPIYRLLGVYSLMSAHWNLTDTACHVERTQVQTNQSNVRLLIGMT